MFELKIAFFFAVFFFVPAFFFVVLVAFFLADFLAVLRVVRFLEAFFAAFFFLAAFFFDAFFLADFLAVFFFAVFRVDFFAAFRVFLRAAIDQFSMGLALGRASVADHRSEGSRFSVPRYSLNSRRRLTTSGCPTPIARATS